LTDAVVGESVVLHTHTIGSRGAYDDPLVSIASSSNVRWGWSFQAAAAQGHWPETRSLDQHQPFGQGRLRRFAATVGP
jgi:hypothetical protein